VHNVENLTIPSSETLLTCVGIKLFSVENDGKVNISNLMLKQSVSISRFECAIHLKGSYSYRNILFIRKNLCSIRNLKTVKINHFTRSDQILYSTSIRMPESIYFQALYKIYQQCLTLNNEPLCKNNLPSIRMPESIYFQALYIIYLQRLTLNREPLCKNSLPCSYLYYEFPKHGACVVIYCSIRKEFALYIIILLNDKWKKNKMTQSFLQYLKQYYTIYTYILTHFQKSTEVLEISNDTYVSTKTIKSIRDIATRSPVVSDLTSDSKHRLIIITISTITLMIDSKKKYYWSTRNTCNIVKHTLAGIKTHKISNLFKSVTKLYFFHKFHVQLGSDCWIWQRGQRRRQRRSEEKPLLRRWGMGR